MEKSVLPQSCSTIAHLRARDFLAYDQAAPSAAINSTMAAVNSSAPSFPPGIRQIIWFSQPVAGGGGGPTAGPCPNQLEGKGSRRLATAPPIAPAFPGQRFRCGEEDLDRHLAWVAGAQFQNIPRANSTTSISLSPLPFHRLCPSLHAAGAAGDRFRPKLSRDIGWRPHREIPADEARYDGVESAGIQARGGYYPRRALPNKNAAVGLSLSFTMSSFAHTPCYKACFHLWFKADSSDG